MQLTTLNILKALPLDPKQKENLVTNFDSYPPEKKFVIEQIVWSAYDDLFRLKLEEKLEMGKMDAEKNNTELGKDFYQRMRKETEDEIMSQSVAAAEKVDLDVTREKLATVIGSSGDK